MLDEPQVISDEVRATLDGDGRLHHPKEIAVDVRNGTVTLRGTVRSLHQRQTAVELARSVPGVRAVRDDLQLDPRDFWDDDELRGVALQALIDDERVPADRLDVSVRERWLTLKGQVRRQTESNAAFDVVSQISGLGGITNKIEVISPGRDG